MLLQEGQLVDGFFQGIQRMEKGGKYKLTIPAELAYGASPPPTSNIPPNSDLIFEVELVDFMSQEDAERRVMALQQAMEAQQGAQGGGQGGPAAGGPPLPPQN